jgi:hypothetical protein
MGRAARAQVHRLERSNTFQAIVPNDVLVALRHRPTPSVALRVRRAIEGHRVADGPAIDLMLQRHHTVELAKMRAPLPETPMPIFATSLTVTNPPETMGMDWTMFMRAPEASLGTFCVTSDYTFLALMRKTS